MNFFDLLLTIIILSFFIIMYLVVPSVIAYFLIKRKWMTERTRIVFGYCLSINVAVIVIFVLIRIWFG